MKRTVARIAILAVALSGSTALASADAATRDHAHRTAQASAHEVTIRVDKTEPVLNSKVEIKGSVSPAAPGAAVALHVRYQGRHHWKTIDSGRLNSASKYRFKDKVGSVRTRKYRVVMVAGANRSAGHSPAVKVTVFGWRNLTSLDPVIGQNLYESGKATINGVPYESSITGGTGRLDYNLVRDCKRLDAVYGLSDSSEAAGSTTLALTADGVLRHAGAYALTQAQHVVTDVTGVFRVTFSASATAGGVAAIGTPKVLCSF